MHAVPRIGFVKGDYEPREGRQGRVIVDDPSKYPDKDDIGLFKGISGGWAGGEAALYKFREQIKVGGTTEKKLSLRAEKGRSYLGPYGLWALSFAW